MKRLIAGSAMIVLSACIGDETITAYGASGTVWKVAEIDGKAFTATATLEFTEPGQIVGATPCNRFTTTMTTPYPWFETGPIAATKTICPESDAEQRFLSALAEMSLAEVVGETMILSTPEGRSIILKAADERLR